MVITYINVRKDLSHRAFMVLMAQVILKRRLRILDLDRVFKKSAKCLIRIIKVKSGLLTQTLKQSSERPNFYHSRHLNHHHRNKFRKFCESDLPKKT